MTHRVKSVSWAVFSAALMVTCALHAERQPFSRYQSVVDRQMFGLPPPGFDPTKPPSEVSAKEEREKEQELTKEQEQVKSAIHFSVINVTPSGETAVGFTDNSNAKEPKHYYLKVGESRDGWTVKEADALAAKMKIAKDDIEVELTLGGNSANGGTKKTGGAPAGVASPGVRGARAAAARPGPASMLGSLRERRALRNQQRAASEKAAAEAKEAAAAAAEEKEAQREAERAAEKAQRDAEQAEMRKKLTEMADALKKQRDEAEAKKAAEAEDKGEDDE